MPVPSYSTTPADNDGAPPNGAPEGQLPSSLNNCIRQIMADVAVESQKNQVKVLGTVAGTNTVTGNMTPALTAYSAGMAVIFTPAVTNTAATTLAINGLTALDVQKGDHVALAAGDLVAGVPALIVLDSGADDFILMNPQAQFLVKANNLSDVTAATARTNLAVPGAAVAAVITGAWTFTARPITTGGGGFLSYASATQVSGAVTVSTSDPSGTPLAGDRWVKYTA